MPYNIVWTENSKKDLKKLEKTLSQRIFEKIIFCNEKDLLFLEKLKNQMIYKFRVGDYRIFFEKGPHNSLFVLTIRHRKNAYKK